MASTSRVIGAALLICGSCIGAGMLALPILTGLSGFFPSMIMFFLAGGFMTLTAFLLVEVNSWHHHSVNLITMYSHSLGMFGRAIGWILYLLLFYALLVAYISLSGNHVSQFLEANLSIKVPDSMGGLFFVILFGGLIYLGTRPVDLMNRALMALKILAYLGLVFLGFQWVHKSNLEYVAPKHVLAALPVLVISFGFHNLIPSLCAYLKGDQKKVKLAITLGALFALCIYIIWEIVALGSLPIEIIKSSYQADIGAAEAISRYVGKNTLGVFANLLAFFAILTSFLAQSLSLVHFLRDGLKMRSGKRENPWMCLLALLPPLLFSILFPQLFFGALNFAGGICAVILFGVLPCLMVWIGRYRQNKESSVTLKGGKPLLVLLLAFSLFILGFQIYSMVSHA